MTVVDNIAWGWLIPAVRKYNPPTSFPTKSKNTKYKNRQNQKQGLSSIHKYMGLANRMHMEETGKDSGLETLLQLDGEVFPMDNGYWVKFKIHTTPQNSHIPHGIRYSLTLHDKYNRRIIGYDNAHGITPAKKKKFSGTRQIWDHKHQEAKVHPYEFEDAYQLLEDFWNDVNNIIE